METQFGCALATHPTDSTLITGNSAVRTGSGHDSRGGGIDDETTTGSSLTITDSTITGNSATIGGGIASSTLIMTNSTVSTNTAISGSGLGGGIYGGGNVSSSTLLNNTAVHGGGVYGNAPTFVIGNSTLTGNFAYDDGGAVFGGVTVTNSTLAYNRAANGGGMNTGNSSIARLHSSIVANNQGDTTAPDVWGAVISDGYNLIGDASTVDGLVSTDQGGLDPLLSQIALNAPGNTQTLALSLNSPAVGRGECSSTLTYSALDMDQRGVARKLPCDVGAYETLPSGVTATPTGTLTPTNTPTLTPTPFLPTLHITTCTLGQPGSLDTVVNTAPSGSAVVFDVDCTANNPITLVDTLQLFKSITLDATGHTVLISGNQAIRVLSVNSGATVTLIQLTLIQGQLTDDVGAGILNDGLLTLTNSTVMNNTILSLGNPRNQTVGGAGLMNRGTLTLTNSTVMGNTLPTYTVCGAGCRTYGNSGAGILNTGRLTLNSSTIVNNTASFNGGGIDSTGILTVNDSTIADNAAGDTYVTYDYHSTYQTYFAGSGGGIAYAGTLNLRGSLLAGNTTKTTGPNLWASNLTVNSGGHNLIDSLDSTSGVSGWLASDQQNVNPLLGTLTNNGGPTLTLALGSGSPAIGMGDCQTILPYIGFLTDQRGAVRKLPCDVGAYETSSTVVPTFTPIPTATPTSTATVATLHVTNCYTGMVGSLDTVVSQAGGGSTIVFDVDCPTTRPITLETTLSLAQNLVIDGGARTIAITNQGTGPILSVPVSSTVTLNALTLLGGAAGGITNLGTLYANTLHLTNNTGGITNSGSLTIAGSTFDHNTGGSITNSGSLTVSGTTFTNNTGPGIANSGTAQLSSTTFTQNTGGGAVSNWGNTSTLTITNSTFTNNSASLSGGALSVAQGQVTVHDSTFTGNTVTSTSGFGTGTTTGGALVITGGIVTMYNSTFTGNSAPGGGGAISNWGTLIVYNSTLAGNTALTGPGGAIYSSSSLTLTNSTLANNTAGSGGGLDSYQAAVLLSTILAGNTASYGTDVMGQVSSSGYNLIGNLDSYSPSFGWVSSDQRNVNPLLNALANNGGSTQTMALQMGSPAIGLGSCSTPVMTDQRGVTRKTPCDVGAYESTFPTPTPTSTSTGTNTSTPSNTPMPSNTATSTMTPLPSSTPTVTGTPTATSTSTATPTATQTSTLTPSPAPKLGLLVGDVANHAVKWYDPTAGSYVDDFVPSGSGGLGQPYGIVIGSDGSVYVADISNSSIKHYDPFGAALPDIVPSGSGGLSGPTGLTIGPDGNLYVVNNATNAVLKYSLTGQLLATFSGGALSQAQGLTFGLDGKLYVASWNSIQRFDMNGNYLGNFVTGNGLTYPNSPVFGPDGNLYVSNPDTNQIVRFTPAGDPVEAAFITGSGTDNMSNPLGITFGADLNLYVVSHGDNSIKVYNGATGAFIKSISGGGLTNPWGIAIKTQNNAPVPTYTPSPIPTATATPLPKFGLLVGNVDNGNIKRYDTVAGSYVDEFVPSGRGGLGQPYGITIGSDGSVYVADIMYSSIKHYTTSGAALPDVVPSGSGGLSGPTGLTIGPDGNLYVVNNATNAVLKYSLSGQLLATFSTGGLSFAQGLTFGPDGKLYVASWNSIKRFDTSGNYLGDLVTGNGLTSPNSPIFGPDGNLYVSNPSTNQIIRFTPAGLPVEAAFITGSGTDNMSNPMGITFASDLNLYVVSGGDNTIKVYNGATGAFIKSIGGGNLTNPWGIAIKTQNNSPVPTYTPSATFTPLPTATATNTHLPTATPTHTPVTPTKTPSITKTPSKTPIPPTSTPSCAPTVTPTGTRTSTPTPSKTPTGTPTPTKTPTPCVPTNTPTPSKTNTPGGPTLTPTFVPPTKTPTPVAVVPSSGLVFASQNSISSTSNYPVSDLVMRMRYCNYSA